MAGIIYITAGADDAKSDWFSVRAHGAICESECVRVFFSCVWWMKRENRWCGLEMCQNTRWTRCLMGFDIGAAMMMNAIIAWDFDCSGIDCTHSGFGCVGNARGCGNVEGLFGADRMVLGRVV